MNLPTLHPHVKWPVTMPGNAELTWLPSLRNSCGVRTYINSLNSMQDSHQDLKTCGLEGLRLFLVMHQLMKNRCHTWQAHPEEERSRKAPKVWPRKTWKESEDDGSKTQYCYGPHINALEDAATREGVVARRVKGYWG